MVKTADSAAQHQSVVEMEAPSGYRFWSQPMSSDEIEGYIEEQTALGYSVSDVDCSGACAHPAHST